MKIVTLVIYKFNSGFAVKNIGSMTFKGDNNISNNYNLNISNTEILDLNQFENVDNVKDIEQILLNSGYLTKTSDESDFTIKLPTLFASQKYCYIEGIILFIFIGDVYQFIVHCLIP